MNFEFATANRIVFGEGKAREVAALASDYGTRGLVVTGKDASRADWLLEDLGRLGCKSEVFSVCGEPTVELVEKGAEDARQHGCGWVIGLGGGSVIDAGKAVAALATNLRPVMDYLEVIGKGQTLENEPLPYMAVPTTAGTGAEVTRNAVLASKEDRVKVSLRSAKMLPTVAVVDPELTYGLPAEMTAYSGLDALTQLIEPYVCTKANPMTDAFCREALPRVARSLPLAFREGSNSEARREMALGSLFGGLALANGGLGAVHGFAAPIGGMFEAAHGAVCAALLPGVMAVNLRAVQERKCAGVGRFDEVARLLTGSAKAKGDDGVKWIEKLCRELQVPGLRRYGVAREAFDLLCARAEQASSMKANPVKLTREELREVLERAL